MVFDITYLKKIRRQVNLTQKEFSRKAGVSQSMIAKIESGKLDTAYSNVKKIEQALESLTKQQEKEAKDIMIKNIISVSPREKVSNIIKTMRKYTISQLPVLNNEKVIGLISESSILNKNLEDIKNLTARDVMGEAPPIIDKNAKIELVKQILRFYPLILVKEE